MKTVVDVNGDIIGYLEDDLHFYEINGDYIGRSVDDKIKVFDKESFLRYCKEAYKYEDLNKLITVYF